MGRSNPTYRDIVTSLRDDWQDYRRALRREDREHFDRLFNHAENHADAAGYQNPTDPFRGVLVSILLSQERRIHELEQQLDAEG